MKKIILMMFFIASAFTITSCKKDKETDNSQATIAKLQGRWEATKINRKIYEVQSNKLVSEKTTSYPANERAIEYKGSEIMYYRTGTLRNTYSYTIKGSEILMRQGNEGYYFQLKFYSDMQHSHTEEETYTSNNMEMKEVSETYYNKK